jgi:methionyl-tRNA formyltransferase
LRIGWVGFHEEGVRALRAVVEAGHEVVGVLTLRPKLAKRRSAATDYGPLCEALGIPVFYVKNINDLESVAELRRLDLDLCVVLGWSQILRREALACARLGTVGAHASYLPHNRGSAPVNWAILRGESRTGNTLMWLSEGVDEGQIVAQRAFPITPFDTCASVYEKVAATNGEMVLELIQKLEQGERPATPQPPTRETILPRRRPEDGEIDWSLPAREIYDFIRGLTRPYPGAYSFRAGEKLTVWKVALLPSREDSWKTGQVVGPALSPEQNACGQVVQAIGGRLLLLEIEDEQGQVLAGQALASKQWHGTQFLSSGTAKRVAA